VSSKHEEMFDAMLGPPPARGPEIELEDDEEYVPGDGEPVLRDAVEAWAQVAPRGVVAMPTYVSDLVVKNLSLAEQSVFHRLFRLSGGFHRSTARVRPADIGKACGLRATLVTAAIRSLAEKGLVVARRRNPLTGSARYVITLPDLIEKTLRVCGVCHRLIEDEEGEAGWLPVPISLKPDGSYQFVDAHAECMEGATL
jgi:hypothetical protein